MILLCFDSDNKTCNFKKLEPSREIVNQIADAQKLQRNVDCVGLDA